MDGGVLASRSRVEKQFFIGAASEETSDGLRFEGTSLVECFDQWVDLVKRGDAKASQFCASEKTSQGKFLIQLESLILAQSERWRQA